MLVKIGLELLLGFLAVEQKFLPGPESQPADVAVRDAGGGADEPYDLKIPFWHGSIVSNPVPQRLSLRCRGNYARLR